MDCALWLNRKKISTAEDIPENLDIASLRGYFLAGSLIPWLNEHGGKRYAKRLAALSPDDPQLNGKIARIFGGSADASAPYKALEGTAAGSAPLISALSSFNIGSAGSYNYAALSSFGSFYNFIGSLSGSGSLEFLTSFSSSSSYTGHEWEWLWNRLFGGSSSFGVTSGGSFSYGWGWLWNLLFGGSSSFGVTSGGSFSYGWEWLWNWLFGSSSSFGVTSFGSFSYGWEWLWNWLFGGSSSFGVTSGGSFSYGWEWLRRLFGFGSFNWSIFGSGSFGSFDRNMLKVLDNAQNDNAPPVPQLDEYDLILLKTLINCPLDRFGYGIHNI